MSLRSIAHEALGKEQEEDIARNLVLRSVRALYLPMTVTNHHGTLPDVGKGFTYIVKDAKPEQCPPKAFALHTDRARNRRKYYLRKDKSRKSGVRKEFVSNRGMKKLTVPLSPWRTHYIAGVAMNGGGKRVRQFYLGSGYTILNSIIEYLDWQAISGWVHLNT